MKAIFYQFYVWATRLNFANSPHLSAMYLIAFFLTLDCMGIDFLIRLNVGGLENNLAGSRIIIVAVLALITFVIYLLYVRNKKYLIIEQEYNLKTEKQKKIIKFITIGFIAISIILPYSGAVYNGYFKNKDAKTNIKL